MKKAANRLVFSTISDEDYKAIAFKHWTSVDKDYKTALTYTGFDINREEELEGLSNYFFNTGETNNIQNFLTFYRFFKGQKKHEYDYYFLIDSNIFFPTYFLRDYFKYVEERKIDISSPVHEVRHQKIFKFKSLVQKVTDTSFDTDICDGRAICLSKKAVKKLDSITRKRFKFDKKTFNDLSFLAINFTPIKYL